MADSVRLGITYAAKAVGPTHPMRGPFMILKGFERAGWDVDIVTALSGQNAGMENFWGTVPLRKVGNGSASNGRWCMNREMLRRRQSHITFSWVWEYQRNSLAAAKRLWGNPYALVLDSYTHGAPWNRENLIDRLKQGVRYGIALRNADLILAEAPFIRDFTKQQFPHVEILYVPVCMWLRELQAIEQGWSQEGFAPQRKPVILYAGSVYAGKGVHDLLTVFARLAGSFPEWSVEIVGPSADEEYSRRLRQIIEDNGLLQRVHFSSMLTGEALYRRYRSCSIYCLPTYHEGVPMTILEAMYFGGAIVAGNAGFVSHQLDDGRCGMLFQPGDVDTLRLQLEQLMAAEDLRRHYMELARARAVNNFVWELYFDTVEEACRRHIQGKNARRPL